MDMKKAIKQFVFLLIIMFDILLLRFDNSKLKVDHIFEIYIDKENADIISKEDINEDSDNTEHIEKNAENLVSDKDLVLETSKENFIKKYGIISDYININGSTKTLEDFADYVISNYGLNSFNKIAEGSEENLSRDFYTETGKSLFIILDEFLEKKDYEQKVSGTSNEVNMTFAGDICLTEDGFVIDYYDTVAGLEDCISGDIIEKTNKADIFMLNNEFCFSDRGTALTGKLYTFKANPERINILKELGTDIVSLANNHVYDFGIEGFSDTLKYIDEAGIKRVGAGANSSEAEKVIYYDVNGMKIGIVSASRAEKVRYTPGAKEDSAGIFLMYETERLIEVISIADKQCDFLIAYIHWGTEDSKYFEQYQQEIAKRMIDSGVDAIIGGHPHVLQGIEYIDEVPVIYSLGDFWFNNETKYTAMVNLKLDINGVKGLSVEPCIQSNYKTTLITDEESKKEFFTYLRELSNGCNIDDLGNVTK